MKTRVLHQPLDAAELLKKGEVVALPTETVYGLAGNATEPGSVMKIFSAKERPFFDPLIVHLPKISLMELVEKKIIDASVLLWKNRKEIESLMEHFWPGPLTLILPKGSRIPKEVTGNQSTVGIRCPKHPLFQEVLAQLDFPLAAPSANRFGRISPTNAADVMKELNGRIAAVLDGGPCKVGVESTILKITEDSVTLLRPGKISKSELNRFIKVPIQSSLSLMESLTHDEVSPGMLDEHYAPRKPLYLIPDSFLEKNSLLKLKGLPGSSEASAAFLAMAGMADDFPFKHGQECRILSPEKSLEEMAQKLFFTLRELDENERVATIFADVPIPHEEGLAASIVDRLNRASRNKPFQKKR